MNLKSKQQEQQLKIVNPPQQNNWTSLSHVILESCKSHVSLLRFYFKNFLDQIINFTSNSLFL